MKSQILDQQNNAHQIRSLGPPKEQNGVGDVGQEKTENQLRDLEGGTGSE